MNFNKQEYLLSWAALLVILLSGTFLVLVPYLDLPTFKINFILSLISWTLIAVSSIYLFTLASRSNLLISLTQPEQDKKEKTVSRENRQKEKPEQESLDIQAISKKIVRRVSAGDNPEEWGRQLLSILVSEIELMSGIFYYKNDKNIFESLTTFAYPHATSPYSFKEGEGLTGHVAKSKQVTVFRSIPDEYTEVFSGLGKGKPSYLAVVPFVKENKTIAVLELAGFRFSGDNLEQLFQIISRELVDKAGEKSPESPEQSSPGDRLDNKITAGQKNVSGEARSD